MRKKRRCGSSGTSSRRRSASSRRASSDCAAIELTERIQAIKVTSLLGGKGFPLSLVNYALNAQSKMVDAMNVYEQVATLLQKATQSDGQAKDDMLASASSLITIADKLMGDGYGDYINAQVTAGTYTPQLTAPPGSGLGG